ncbi:carbohydrate ABC transporter permease [Paenibacillus methanolicus]|uniref:Multiple sugar transport system permease protein/putative aldouronate transport system permease protein n=1 Tax=Paenibacillus methanolicus TaxID=582686 RepID=A0A5S5CEP7_9BACL|nr:carbohydrate ABC transporter permease [Paenibacillus methanolicus]TYP76483.1 multiple sugar transport system permease protein/putative aldouronate transport system permease protein [Paenibacillus methanolicus]
MKSSMLAESRSDRLFNGVNAVVLTLFLIAVLYPLIFIVSASFSDPLAVMSGKVWLYPVKPTLAGYEAVFKHNLIGRSFLNSIFYTAAGTAVNVVMTILAAYPLARRDFYGRQPILFLFLFTMLFSGGLIPSYLLVKELGMLNTAWAMIIPGALGVWNMIVTRAYFQTTIPDELLEAAQIDGCNDFSFVRKIVIPLSGPIIAVIALFYGVAHWNQYFTALIFLNDRELYPLQLVLRDILVKNQISPLMISDVTEMSRRQALSELLKYSLIVVATLPLMAVYPFVQKHFIKGVMIGSLKG